MTLFNFFYFQQPDSLDQTGTVDVNPQAIVERVDSWVDGFIRSLPNIGVAIILILIGFFVARFIGNLIHKSLGKSGRDNLGDVLGGFARWVIFILIFLLALTIVLPTLSPGDLIAGLGVSSVAIGFAFKDILQNWLAGLLILLRQPFQVGDQIIVSTSGYEGTVERIETRATIIKMYNGEEGVIPNSEIYTNSVRVRTADDIRRTYYDVGIGYGDSIDEAVEVIEKTMHGLSTVDNDKGYEVLVWGLDASWVTLRVRWWIKSDRKTEVNSRSQVLRGIKLALDEARIDMPYETAQMLFHDQTEATDGDRAQQREGWPQKKEGDNPKPRWQAREEMRQRNGTEVDKTKSDGDNSSKNSTNIITDDTTLPPPEDRI